MDRAGFRSRRERFRRMEGHPDRTRRRIRRRRRDSCSDRAERQRPPSRRNDSDAARESLRHDSRRFAGGGRCDQLACCTRTIKPKDFLPAFLNAIVLAATGAKLPERFRAIVIGTQSKPNEWIREFAPMDRDSALAYLTTVVSDLLSTGNDYFLPIEAVEKSSRNCTSRRIAATWSKLSSASASMISRKAAPTTDQCETPRISIRRTKKRSKKSSRAASTQ